MLTQWPSSWWSCDKGKRYPNGCCIPSISFLVSAESWATLHMKFTSSCPVRGRWPPQVVWVNWVTASKLHVVLIYFRSWDVIASVNRVCRRIEILAKLTSGAISPYLDLFSSGKNLRTVQNRLIIDKPRCLCPHKLVFCWRSFMAICFSRALCNRGGERSLRLGLEGVRAYFMDIFLTWK